MYIGLGGVSGGKTRHTSEDYKTLIMSIFSCHNYCILCKFIVNIRHVRSKWDNYLEKIQAQMPLFFISHSWTLSRSALIWPSRLPDENMSPSPHPAFP